MHGWKILSCMGCETFISVYVNRSIAMRSMRTIAQTKQHLNNRADAHQWLHSVLPQTQVHNLITLLESVTFVNVGLDVVILDCSDLPVCTTQMQICCRSTITPKSWQLKFIPRQPEQLDFLKSSDNDWAISLQKIRNRVGVILGCDLGCASFIIFVTLLRCRRRVTC